MVILEFLKVNSAVFVLLHNFIVSEASEGRLAEYHHMEDDSKTEQIAGGSIGCSCTTLQIGNLGSHVAGSPTTREDEFFRTCTFSKAEVTNNAFACTTLPEENILGFDVPMHEVTLMHALQSLEDVLHYCPSFMRREFILILNAVMQPSAGEEFDADIDGVFGLINLMDLHQVLML